MKLTRRHVLKASAASWLLAGMPRARGQAGGKKKAPRYFVTVFLRGGIDAVYTTDPKTKNDVAANVDVPYDVNAIVDGPIQLGPHFRPLQKFASQMAILRGVQVSTANHETGAYQVLRMRTDVMPNMPSLFDILGQHREGQPLASVALGKLSSFEHSPDALIAPTGDSGDGETSLDAVDQLSDEDVDILAEAFKKHLTRFPSALSAKGERTKEHVAQTAAFFDKMKGVKRFKPVDWGMGKNNDAARAGEDLQRTLWFLENDLTRGVFTKIQFDWDSHYRNVDKQTSATGDFTKIFSKFLDGLHERKNAFGSLAEQTVVVCGSELGRFPVINGNLGKDHFPEAQYLLMGPNINVGNAFVPTGKHMEGQKINLKTGKADDNGERLVLDDLGATLMHAAGLNPTLYGYNGRLLPFLVKA